ncbi:MAG: AAA family ATPase [Gammaproteobacteria bacterium]|nr:AAA family ATPase [Gammaproteobacteria bacterium]
MRILAIRGKNLASLAGEFELHFRQPPLADAGLFAICGPTGSGKSTLLDALCLALYDATPRLTRAAGKSILPDIGEDTLTPQDSRNLLRRGAGDGFAEVDFVGNDNVAYRARWSVRRARGKASGKLQSTELSLHTLDGGQPIGGLKTEVQKAIRERLGLSFEQFTRAVLLAQNEFAAFLKVDDNERAELLETLTGLDIYSEISKRAFERAKVEQQALDSFQQQLADQRPLDPAQRAEREQQLTLAKEELVLLEQRKNALDRQRQWHETWEKLQRDQQQALENFQKTQAEQQAAAPRQQQLAQVEAVQDARPLVDAADRAAAEVDRNRQVVLDAEQRRDAAQRRQQQAETVKAQAVQAVNAADRQRSEASPALNQARRLDAEIDTLTPTHQTATKVLAETQQFETAAKQRLADQQTERQRIAQQLQTAQGWLTQHQPLRLLAEDWLRWNELLKDAAALHSDLRAAEQKVTASQRDAQEKRQALEQATSERTQAAAALQTAENQRQAALVKLADFDTEALATRRQTTQARADRLTEAERLWMALEGGLTRQRALEDESRTLQAQVAQAETALKQIQAARLTATARREQAEKSLKMAEAASSKSVETLRASLETGVPCPVCGATEHPYATDEAPSRAMLASLKAEVGQCRQAQETLVAQESAQQTGLDNHRQRQAALAKERESLHAALQRDSDTWNAQPFATELKELDPAHRLPWFADQRRSIREQLAAIDREETAQRQAAQQRDDAQQTHDQAQKQHSAAQDVLNAAQTAYHQATHTLQTAQERQTACAHQLEQRLADLETAFSGHDWRPLWQADPVAFHATRQRKVTQWRDQSQKAERWQNQLNVLDPAIHGQTGIVADKTTQRQRAAEAFHGIDQDLQIRRQQRQALFAGRTVADVEARLAKTIEDAQSELQRQEAILQQTVQERIGVETTLDQRRKILAESQQAATQATAALQRWMAESNVGRPDAPLDWSTLRAWLAHDRAWIGQEREMLQGLADAVRQAETILKERQAQREAHEQQRLGPDSAEVVQAAQRQIILDEQAVQSRHTEAAVDLRRDDERRTKTAGLQADWLQQAAKTEIWSQLNEVIGSADGKKFRNHAQQFTLDVLLGYANRHLADLSRRYRLERIPDHLALMVVDQDMGDERRSVHSLSGGESFLVSLALALGLASLSSNRVRVESLFIDEGFGSLDGDTLRVAMDALDRLQAQGRKVGVISHVQEMTERIGVQIHVQRQSGGQSRVEVRGGC